ncbi:hypothetical protein QAD02_015113 [Eretmocerus hayati]|uniref:Uncharacterized protein n=1 Tax=Eretmocerus hayati TaxID=131215 RepID=A0ACC2P7C3_9HYME|nr:hypothetical protein QAD02_015113 [Eretmocerus hayati]
MLAESQSQWQQSISLLLSCSSRNFGLDKLVSRTNQALDVENRCENAVSLEVEQNSLIQQVPECSTEPSHGSTRKKRVQEAHHDEISSLKQKLYDLKVVTDSGICTEDGYKKIEELENETNEHKKRWNHYSLMSKDNRFCKQKSHVEFKK